ncbi:aspartyl/glutamyl-tRNA amidotransferase subunit C, partial [bacterium]|nr:aspartyl/glutamyl-tRNA amidotransferase subunit C [bacterium]
HLARLEMTPQQQLELGQQLNTIFGLIDQLSQQDTQAVEPLSHPLAILEANS